MSAGSGAAVRNGWRPTLLIALGGAGGLLALALATADPVPIFLAVPLLLAPAALAVSAPAPDGRVTLDWQADGEGTEIVVTGSLTPTPGIRPADLAVDLPAPAALAARSPPELWIDGGAVRFRCHWSCRRPTLVVLPPPGVRWQDGLGLSSRTLPVDGATLHIERFPPEVMRLGRTRLRRTTPQPGESRSPRIGSGGEFFAVRGAAPNDTSRQVNWRASARLGRLLANDYLLERTGDLLILLDLRPSPLGPERDGELTAVARSAALGIATAFLAEKARVGVGLYSEFLETVPLNMGRMHRTRIARLLEYGRPSDIAGPPERMAVAARRAFPPGVTTLLISALADPDDSLVLVRSLRQRGFDPVVLSPSPLALERERGPPADADAALRLRLFRLARRLDLARIWGEAPVVDWDDFWSLGPLVLFLSTPRLAARRSR